MNIIDKPVSLKTEQYDELFARIKNYFVKNDYIIDMYKFGSVSNPGISDLDIMLVVKDGYSFNFNDYCLDRKDKIILTHNPFIIPEKYLSKARLISPYFGEFDSINVLIRRQIAIEFLIKFFISLTIQLNLKTIKLRNILLETKAAKEDFIELGVYEQVMDIVNYFMDIRDNYFSERFDRKIFLDNLNSFYNKLKQIVIDISEQRHFYFSKDESYTFMRNVKLLQSKDFNISIKGFFPFIKSISINRKIMNLMNRFYSYRIYMNWQYYDDNQLLNDMYLSEKEIINYHNKHFLNFICPISPLIV